MSDDDLEDLLYALEDGKDVRYIDSAKGTIHRVFGIRSHWWFPGGLEEEAALRIEDGKWVHLRNADRSNFVLLIPALPKTEP
jgi:hypothetical protein